MGDTSGDIGAGGDGAAAGTVADALRQFHEKHGYGPDGGAGRRIAFLHLGRLRIPFPNSRARRAALYVHDVNHLVTGYDTSWRGEARLAAWELRTLSWGGRVALWLLVSAALAWGLVLTPRGLRDGWRLGRATRGVPSLGLGRDALLAMPLSELRARLGFDAGRRIDVPAAPDVRGIEQAPRAKGERADRPGLS
ncbi:MAG TPA: hypothetical protein VEA69_08480 [Tepidisphaeraceae bacterium]|nr:hypothetical protein [Tepidisphaeraceae bacterium]